MSWTEQQSLAVTQRVIDLMATKGSDWKRPWSGSGLHKNIVSKRAYSGVNVIITGLSGRTSPYWGTYKQWTEIGAQVRKGEKSTPIFFMKPMTAKDEATGEEKQRFILRSYIIFNIEQCDNVPLIAERPKPLIERHADCDDILALTGANISHGGDKAFYSPSTDSIRLPKIEQFDNASGYYGTAFHELGHWTGHATRLDRKLSGKFGTPEYAFEELIAELSSAILCAMTGIEAEPRHDHARYLNSWIKGLTDQPSALMMAASRASKAVSYIKPEAQPEIEPTRPGAAAGQGMEPEARP